MHSYTHIEMPAALGRRQARNAHERMSTALRVRLFSRHKDRTQFVLLVSDAATVCIASSARLLLSPQTGGGAALVNVGARVCVVYTYYAAAAANLYRWRLRHFNIVQ